MRRRCTRLNVLTFFTARTAGRFVRISARLPFGFPSTQTVMTDTLPDRAAEFHAALLSTRGARGRCPLALPRDICTRKCRYVMIATRCSREAMTVKEMLGGASAPPSYREEHTAMSPPTVIEV